MDPLLKRSMADAAYYTSVYGDGSDRETQLSRQDLERHTGHTSFFSCYRWLKETGKANTQYLIVPNGNGPGMLRFSVREIKAKAMDEAWDNLPLMDSVEVMKETVAYGENPEQVISFLSNLLTRSKCN